MKKSRRSFIAKSTLGLLGAGLGTGLSIYSYQRGLRLPTLHWDPRQPNTSFAITGDTQAFGSDLIQTSNTDTNIDASFRAFAPEPSLSLHSTNAQRFRIRVNNIITDAELRLDADQKITFNEEVNGTQRNILIELNANQKVVLNWKLAKQASYHLSLIHI